MIQWNFIAGYGTIAYKGILILTEIGRYSDHFSKKPHKFTILVADQYWLLEPIIMPILYSLEILPLKSQWWLILALYWKYWGMKCHHCRNICFILEILAMKHQ